MEDLARALVRAEDRLRARGLTGGEAFDELMRAVEQRLGLPGPPPSEAARELAAALPLTAGDPLGLAYETFFADLFKGLRGQFFTPPPIARLLVARLAPGPGETVLDPTCGSGGLLIAAAASGARVRGIERDARLARLAAVNLRRLGLDAPIVRADFFTAEPSPVDALIANPPFSVVIDDPEVLERYALGRGQRRALSDHLFLEAIERWVRPGGRAALVLPMSILVNPSAEALRERVDRAWVRTGVCALPEGVFRPFGGAAGRAFLLWLTRRPAAPAPAWWAELADPGYDVRSSRVRRTTDTELDQRVAGVGFEPLPPGRWVPPAADAAGRRVADLATLAQARVTPSREPGAPVALVELADADRATGEVRPRVVAGAEVNGPRVALEPGDVLVAQLRPNLGNVAVVPEVAPHPLVGSPEWVVLRAPRLRHWLCCALRTPTWRDALPLTGGQTRPRTTPAAVHESALPWPGDPVAERVDALASTLHRRRAALRDRLERLQDAVDRFAAGALDAEGLDAEVAALEADDAGGAG